MHFRIFDSAITVTVIMCVAVLGLLGLAYLASKSQDVDAKPAVHARFFTSKKYGFVLDPEYYCPTDPEAERPLLELEGRMIAVDGPSCVILRAIAIQEKMDSETDGGQDLK